MGRPNTDSRGKQGMEVFNCSNPASHQLLLQGCLESIGEHGCTSFHDSRLVVAALSDGERRCYQPGLSIAGDGFAEATADMAGHVK